MKSIPQKKVIPSQALCALHRVQSVVPQAIIAGGCIRDYILKRPIYDIDIFVPDEHFSTAEHAIIEAHPVITEIFSNIPCPNIAKVRYYKGEDWPINLVAAYNCTPEAILKTFDFGFCKVVFDGKYLWKDSKFDIDANNETITLHSSANAEQRERSIKRYGKLVEKYVGWQFIDATMENKQ